MNVGQLIAKLQGLNPESQVVVCGLDGDGYTDATECEPLCVLPGRWTTCQYRTESEAHHSVSGPLTNVVFIG